MRTLLPGRSGWSVAVAAAVVVSAEWLRSPAWWVAVVLAILVVAALTQLRGVRGAPAWTARGALVLLGLLTGWESWRLARIADHWPEEREQIVARASERLGAELDEVTRLVGEVAAGAATACDLTLEEAFPYINQLRGGRGSVISVAILQPTGAPWVWAGRHFAVPAPDGDSLGVQASSTHLALQVRRPCGHARTVVATTLIRSAPSEPMAASALVERFRAETDVAVRVWPGDLAPDAPDVFDYQFDTPLGTRTLFSVQAIPPDQGARWSLVAVRAGLRVVLLVVLLLTAACVIAPPGSPRALLLVVASWFAARVPLARIFDSDSLWSQATFFRDFLGPFSASAGALLVAGAAATILAAAFWERGSRRRPAGIAIAAILTLAAPYLVSSLARGITPPADGVPLGLWLTWEFALVAAAGACVAVASALVRGTETSTKVPWSWWLGVGAAIAGAGLGLSVWSPRGGWPDWYPLPWAAALLLLLWRPAPRWATIVGLGIVAGSAASLLTWGAELEGRLQVARRDIQRLGAELDPLAVPRISRLALLADSAPSRGGRRPVRALARLADRRGRLPGAPCPLGPEWAGAHRAAPRFGRRPPSAHRRVDP